MKSHSQYFIVPIMAYIGIWLLLFSSFSQGQVIPSLLTPLQNANPSALSSNRIQFRHREVLNSTTDTVVEWQVDPERSPNSTITFNFSTTLTDPTISVVLFGISITGLVEGADVVSIPLGNDVEGSTVENDRPSIVDMYGINNTTIAIDTTQQNWRLESLQLNISSTSGSTRRVRFSVSRILDTCDTQDVPINSDLRRLIWGFGEANNATSYDSLNFTPEGSYRVYLTDPTIDAPLNGGAPHSWRISRRMLIPPRHTSYWCTLHKGPVLSTRHQIHGFASMFDNQVAQRHIHHQLIYRCIAPPGVDPAIIFDQFVGHPGEECYLEGHHQLPFQFCTEMVHAWGIGARDGPLPTDFGLALGTTPNEYFMFEAHYDNPEIRSDLVVYHGAELYYSTVLRPNEGSIIFVGTGIFSLFTIPPQVPNFTWTGQCSPQCTLQMGSLSMLGGALHAHTTARRMTLRHFRGNQELPVLISDQNYDNTFQTRRMFPRPVELLPGDHLVTECVLNTTSRNTTTLSGYATRDEMCNVFLYLSKRVPNLYCTSEYPTDRTMARYGIRNMTWDTDQNERIVRDADNPDFVGQTLKQVIDETVGTWTPEIARQIERQQLYEEHDSTCQPLRYLLPIGQGIIWAGQATGQIFPGDEIGEQLRPTTRTISGTDIPTLYKVSYPAGQTTYTPPETCSSN